MLGSRLMSCTSAGVVYKGSVTKEEASADGWDSPAEALDVLSIASVGDLVLIAFSFDNNPSSFSWNGMSFTIIRDGTSKIIPGYYIGYRFVQSGDTNPYISGASGEFKALSVVASVFGGVTTFEGANDSNGVEELPDPPSLNPTSGELWIATGHIDDEEITDWVAPTNYTLADFAAVTALTTVSSTVIAYRIESLSSDNPSAFGGSGDESWHAETIAFS